MSDDEVGFASIPELARRLRSRELSCVELTQALLARIERLDPTLGAFVALTRERALAEARAAQQELDAGRDRGALHGIPYAAKDVFDIAGEPNSAGTRLLEDRVAQRDCRVVRALAEAGMVLLGRLHTVQLAASIVGVNHERGTPRNPWAQDHHVPGGSSSGSAVAVAAGLVPMALGTDTGGSVRTPSSLCGTVGLKTTVGRVSRAGVFPLSATLDSVGVLTRTVEDAALTVEAIAGPDPEDEATLGHGALATLATLQTPLKGMRLALCSNWFMQRATVEVAAAIDAAASLLARLGADLGAVALPEVEQVRKRAPGAVLIAAEAYAAHRDLFERHAQALDPFVARLGVGSGVKAHEYLAALAGRRELARAAAQRLEDVDALLVPTTPDVAHPLAEVAASAQSHDAFSRLYMHCTYPGNLLDLCAVSVPCGFTTSGLPIGLMIYAKPFEEHKALRVAHAFERATPHHLQRPPSRQMSS